MLTNTEIARIVSLISDSVFLEKITTTDDTPVVVKAYELTAAEILQVEVVCTAMKDTTGGFISRMANTFFYNGGTVEVGGLWGYITKEYLGAGLSTADFDFVIDGNRIDITWTGEAGATINANFRIQISRMVNTALP